MMKAEDFINYLASVKGPCSRCDEILALKGYPLCFRHAFLQNKLSYIAQEMYGFRLGLNFVINHYGPTASAIRLMNMGVRTLDQILEGKKFRIEMLTYQERKFLETLTNFFSCWKPMELELLTTEHMLTKRTPSEVEITDQKIDPFVEIIRKVRGLRGLSRWQLIPTAISQNLAEHTCNVVLISMILCDILRAMGFLVSVENVLRKAAIHDLEEVAIGFDVPTPVKYSDKNIETFIKETSNLFFKEMIKKIPKNIQKKYLDMKREEESLEEGIVQIADKLDALLFALEQVKLGNNYFKTVVDEKIAFLKNVKPQVLQPLTKAIINSLMRDYQSKD